MKLPWARPTLSNPAVIAVTNDPATRNIVLGATQDARIILPDWPLEFVASDQYEAIVQVFSGRNIEIIGGHILGSGGPVTPVAIAVAADDVTLTVDSTAGFPESGYLRLDGEGMLYTSKTATTFSISERRSGFYNTSPISSDTTHPVGAKVYLGEYSRSGLSLSMNHGAVHLEGMKIDGFVNDGIRIAGGLTTSVTVQNCRIGPVTNHDRYGQTDGHPDAIQLLAGGTPLLRVANTTILAGDSGRAILNAAADDTHSHVADIVMRNVEMSTTEGRTNELIRSATGYTTKWDVANCWLRSTRTSKNTLVSLPAGPDTELAEKFGLESAESAVGDFCPGWVPGLGYTTPGYL